MILSALLLLCVTGCSSGPSSGVDGDGRIVESVAFSPDGKTLAIGYQSLALDVVNPGNGTVIKQFKPKLPEEPEGISSVAFSPDGKSLAAAIDSRMGGVINVWDVATSTRKLYLPQLTQSVAFSPDGKWLAAGGATFKKSDWLIAIQLFDARTGKPGRTLSRPVPGYVEAIAFAPNGKTLVSVNSIEDGAKQSLTSDATVRMWDTRSGKMLWSAKVPATIFPTVAYSPSGTLVANNCADTVQLRDARSGKLLKVLRTKDELPGALAFSPDGKTLASGSRGAIGGSVPLQLWDVQTGALLHTLSDHINSVNTLAYSPDGRWLASGSEDHTVNIWNARSGQLMRTIGQKYLYQSHSFS